MILLPVCHGMHLLLTYDISHTLYFSYPYLLLYRVRKGPNKGAWHHKYFIRDDPDKMRRIERVKIKGKATITVDSDTYSPYLLGVSPRMLIPPSVVVDTPPGTTAPAMVMMMPMQQQQGMAAVPQPEMMMQTTYAANADFDQKSMSLPSVVHTTSPTSVMNSSPKSDSMTMSTMPPLTTTTMPPLPLAMPTVNTHEMFNIDNYVGKNYNMTEADKAAADMPRLPKPSSQEEEQEEDLAEDTVMTEEDETIKDDVTTYTRDNTMFKKLMSDTNSTSDSRADTIGKNLDDAMLEKLISDDAQTSSESEPDDAAQQSIIRDDVTTFTQDEKMIEKLILDNATVATEMTTTKKKSVQEDPRPQVKKTQDTPQAKDDFADYIQGVMGETTVDEETMADNEKVDKASMDTVSFMLDFMGGGGVESDTIKPSSNNEKKKSILKNKQEIPQKTATKETSSSPSNSELRSLVDALFLSADKDTMTVGDINRSVAAHFGWIKVDKKTKKLIKSRLQELNV